MGLRGHGGEIRKQKAESGNGGGAADKSGNSAELRKLAKAENGDMVASGSSVAG
jgi:hypothetical protein